MALVDSRLGPGTATFSTGTTVVECQITNLRFTPEHEQEDVLATLCDPEPAPIATTTWNMAGTAIQDWEKDAPEGFIEFCRTSNQDVVDFEVTFNSTLDPLVVYSGQVTIQAVEFGGDVGTQLTSDFEFPVVGDFTRSATPVQAAS